MKDEFIDNLTLGVYRNTPGPEGRFVIVNNALVEMFEAGSKEALLKLNVSDLYADKSKRSTVSETILRKGSVRSEEIEVVTLKGRRFTAAITAVMKKDEDGRVFFDGIIEDITNRKKEEEERARLAAIVDYSDDAIIGKTLDSIITSWNKGAEKIYGYTAQEMIGRPVSILAAPGRGKEIPRILETIHDGGSVAHFETERVRKDGKVITVSLTVSPIKNSLGEIVGASTIARDISEQKIKEEKLIELSQAVEQSGSIVVITDTSGNIEYANPRFTQATGYSLQEAIGKNPHILKSGETPPEEYKKLWDTITSGGTWHGEFHNRKKSGELYWESATISPVRDAAGKITHFMAIKEDISGQKFLQDELGRKMTELEKFNKVAVGRELKMVELKKEIADLRQELKEKGA